MKVDNTKEEYTMEFFHALAEELQLAGVIVETDIGGFPRVRSAHSHNLGEGWYFKKAGLSNFDALERAHILQVFPFAYNGQAVQLGEIIETEVDIDYDRTWPASFTFFPMDIEAYNTYYDSYEDGEMSEDYYQDRAGWGEPGSYCNGPLSD